MSILTITHEDTQGGRGAPLPNAKWAGIVEEAGVQPEANGTRFFARLGQITTPEGSGEYINGQAQPYRVGNRKVFVREWTDHQSTQATEIGQRRIKQFILAAGLVAKPAKGAQVVVPFESYDEIASAIVGKRILFTSRQAPRMSRKAEDKAAWEQANPGATAPDLVPALDADGTPKVDVEIAAFHTA